MIKAIFFDMYGTLAGFRPSRYEVQSQACANFGISVTHEGILKGYAIADAYMSKENAINPIRLRGQEKRDAFFGEYERLVLEGSDVYVTKEEALEIFCRVQRVPYSLVPFDDVVPVLNTLGELGLILGMISNMDKEGNELARTLGLAEFLHFTVTSAMVGSEKPHPSIFHAALDEAETEPTNAIHVGDQPSSDVEGALGVGIRPVLIDRDRNYPNFDRCPRIETLTELLGLINIEENPCINS